MSPTSPMDAPPPRSLLRTLVADARALGPGHLLVTWFTAMPGVLEVLGKGPVAWSRPIAAGALLGLAWVAAVVLARLPGLLLPEDRGRRSFRRVAALPFYLALGFHALAGVLDTLVLLLFGHRIRPRLLFVVFETNPREALEFVEMYADAKVLGALAVAALPLVLLALARRHDPGRILPRAYTGIILAALGVSLATGTLGIRSRDVPAASFREAAREYRLETAKYRELKGLLASETAADPGSWRGPPGSLHFLVIGESTNRNHMGLYGYPRATTPRLGALGDRLHVLRDVISHRSHTQAVMKELLTFVDAESERPWHEHATLLGAYRRAGFRTYWVSNQEMYGLWSNVTAALASQADVKIFHKNRKARATATSPLFRPAHDGDLLPYVKRIVDDDYPGPRLVVLHLMGTHGWYPNRFPREFAHFAGAKVDPAGRDFLTWSKVQAINAYDDAVRYNDHVMGEVLELLGGYAGSAYLVYLSDHGEELYDARDFLGHTERVGTRHMIEIPMLAWTSAAYRAAHPEKEAGLRRARDLPFMSDHLPHLMLDLSGIEHPALDLRRSPAHPDFDATRRRIYAGRDYDCEMREPPATRCARGP